MFTLDQLKDQKQAAEAELKLTTCKNNKSELLQKIINIDREIKKLNMKLSDLNKGDFVICDGDNGFCHRSKEEIENISYSYCIRTGKKYKVIHLSGDRKFDSRDGAAMNPPLMYYIKIR
jgi:hypothetical protein